MLLAEAIRQTTGESPSGPEVRRETYETELHRKNQQEIADEFCRHKGCGSRPQALRPFSAVDFAFFRVGPSPDGSGETTQHLWTWVECKQRQIVKGQFRTLILSLHKWIEGLKRARATGKPFYFVVRFANKAVYYLEIDKSPREFGYAVRLGGRTNRTDKNGKLIFQKQDIELVVDIPMNDLVPVSPTSSLKLH